MIQIENIHKSFGDTHVLKGVSLNVARGKTRVILGLSGSGKSVLMKHIIGLLKPDQGRVIIDGDDVVGYNDEQMLALRSKFGMVFQHAALFDSMSVFDNVAFPLVEHTRLSQNEIRTRVRDKLDLVGLAGAESKYPAELSGGMRKRVGLARAVILEPTCVLYDEPTTGLDPISTENVDQMILDAAKRFKVTSVVISHDIGSALNVGDQVAVIHEGRIVANGTPEDIRASRHEFVKKFMKTWFGKQ